MSKEWNLQPKKPIHKECTSISRYKSSIIYQHYIYGCLEPHYMSTNIYIYCSTPCSSVNFSNQYWFELGVKKIFKAFTPFLFGLVMFRRRDTQPIQLHNLFHHIFVTFTQRPPHLLHCVAKKIWRKKWEFMDYLLLCENL